MRECLNVTLVLTSVTGELMRPPASLDGGSPYCDVMVRCDRRDVWWATPRRRDTNVVRWGVDIDDDLPQRAPAASTRSRLMRAGSGGLIRRRVCLCSWRGGLIRPTSLEMCPIPPKPWGNTVIYGDTLTNIVVG